jgi:hypothetical protein
MGAVAEAVTNVVSAVVDTVGDVVETVADVAVSAVDTAAKVVEKVIEDPLPTIVAMAGQAVGIPAPVTMAAITAAKGGDLEDIALSAGLAYVAPTVTNSISTTLSSAIGDSIINETVSNTVIDGVSRGLVSGTVAEIRGGDFTDAFAGSFTGTVVNSSVGEFTNEFIKPEIQDMLADSGLDVKTVNTIVNEGSRAISTGLTAEITGRGSFDDAFINSVQNSTINVGTNFASNTIRDEFKQIETGLQQTEDKTGGSEAEMSWDDYYSLDTTREQDSTAAGIGDDLVEEVDVADAGTDSGNATQAVNDMWQDNYYSDLLGSSQDVIDEFSKQSPTDQVAAEEAPSDFDMTAEGDQQDQLADLDWGGYDFGALPQDLQDPFNFDYVQAAGEDGETPVGGLAEVGQDYTEGQPTGTPQMAQAIQVAYDPYEGLTDEDFGLVDANTIDVAGPDVQSADVAPVLEGGLNKVSQGVQNFIDDKTANLGDSALNMVMKNIITPSIRTGLTKAIKGTPTRRVVQMPQQAQRPKPKGTLTPDQLAQLRGALAQQKAPAQKLDMSKILAQSKKPTYTPPPQKVDVSKLTPVTNVASLTELLAKKG